MELKHDGQILNEGHCGIVTQSVLPRQKVVRGHEGNGATLPLSMSSENRRKEPIGLSRFPGWNGGGCQYGAAGGGIDAEGFLSSNDPYGAIFLVSPGE